MGTGPTATQTRSKNREKKTMDMKQPRIIFPVMRMSDEEVAEDDRQRAAGEDYLRQAFQESVRVRAKSEAAKHGD